MSVAEARHEAVTAAVEDIRAIEATHGLTTEGVHAIKDRLLQLAAQGEVFPQSDFPAPGPDAKLSSSLYRVAEDPDGRFALYVNSTERGTSTPAHNHTTWAVIVGINGQEHNRFYERTDDGGVRETGKYTVEDGTGVAFLPDDLHSIHIEGPALNLHMYGLALEKLDQRQYYRETDNSWHVFPAHRGITEARLGLVDAAPAS